MTDQTTPVLELGVPIVLAFSHQRIADMVTTAIESKVGDWFHQVRVSGALRSFGLKHNIVWYAAPQLYAHPGFRILVHVDNPVNDGNGETIMKQLTMEDFQRALILMATAKEGAYARHFADFLGNNEDALTADLFMQFAVYGEEIYS